jgi:hypothetical protein
VKVGEALHGVSEGFLVDLRLGGADAVTDGSVVDSGEF